MDSQTTIEPFKINSTQKPFYDVIEPPINHYKPNNTLSDLSFSTYLHNENSATKAHQTPSLYDPEINVFDAQKYFSETNNDSKEANKIETDSSNINPADSASRISSVSSSVDRYGRNFSARSFHSTPTASSEASWNSQIGLLSKPQGGVSVSLRNVAVDHHHTNKISGSSGGKWFFCRKCPCAGKKSLQVVGELETSTTRTSSMGSDNYQSNFHQPKIQSHRKSNERIVQLQKLSNISLKTPSTDDFPERHLKMGFNNSSRISAENNFILSNDVLLKRVRASSSTPTAFSFPVLKHSSAHNTNPNYKMKEGKSNKTSFEDPARESLEVFQPPQLSRKNIEDDVASDASSDLFEIESFSTQTASNYRKRDSLDEASTLNSIQRFGADNFHNDHEPITPRTECYAPSEVSVDWSVTTAEGFDKASVTNYSITPSEYEDSTISRLRSMEKYGVQLQSSSNLHWNEGGGGKKKAAGNGLLGCRHENAVNVGPNPVKFVKESPPILPLISTSGHVNGGASRPPKPNLAKSSSRAHGRLSLAFAA